MKTDRLEVVKEALRQWDPIGVIELSNPDYSSNNEYDSYALGFLKSIENGNDAHRLAGHLASIRYVTIGIGLERPSEREIDLGEKLVKWRESNYKNVPNFYFNRYSI